MRLLLLLIVILVIQTIKLKCNWDESADQSKKKHYEEQDEL